MRDQRDKEPPAPAPKEQVKASSPQIDLASFPPLPGRTVSEGDAGDKKEEETNNNDLITPMADIVKGVKDPKVRPRSSCLHRWPSNQYLASSLSIPPCFFLK